MSKKKGNFTDQFLDKIVLAVTGLAALYLLWAFVLSNPYGQKVNNQKVSPSQIDLLNKRQSQLIEKKLQDSAAANPYVQDKTADFSSLLGCAIPKLSVAANWPLPGGGRGNTGENPIYVIPQIPVLENVKLAAIRGTVRMPMEEVTPEISYASVSHKAADIDLVTFSAHLNVQALYDNFRQSFMGPRLKPQWKDSTYAEPVPARVELQRCARNAEGSWDEWQTVPFTRIDPYQKMLKEIPLTTEQMTYGDVTLFINSCREFAVMKDILQPDTYMFLSSSLSSSVKWMPAEYYEEYRKISGDEEAKKLREERDRRLREKDPGRGGNRVGANRPQPQPLPRRGGGGREENPMMMEGGMPITPGRPTKPTRTVLDVEKDAASAVLADKAKLNTLKDQVIWIHDDTAVAGTTYRYRLRYGVFNPIAGKDWVAPESKEYKNKVVLWSEYAEILDPDTGLPEPVSVPKMLHLFPMDMLANGAGVNVEIYRYFMGQWHTETFEVYPGQSIGKPMEFKSKTIAGGVEGAMEMGNAMGMNPGDTSQPTQVDYSTGYMLMDVLVAMDWSGAKVWSREVPSMLYLDEKNKVQSMIAKKQYWSKEMNTEYSGVKAEIVKASGASTEGMMPGMEGGMRPGMTTQIRELGGR
jgi:hypothetical protein